MSAIGDIVTVFFDVQPFGGAVVDIGLGMVRIQWNDTDAGRPRLAWFHDLDGALTSDRAGRMMGDQSKTVRYERSN